MKDLKKIAVLLEKYYRGETDRAEEKTLSDFFTGENIPAHLKAESGLFRYFASVRKDTLPGKMEQRLGRMIADSNAEKTGTRTGTTESSLDSSESETAAEPYRIDGGMKLRSYWIGAAAAVILILLGIFVDMQIRNNNSLVVRQDTFEDPYLAFAEAQKVLYMVSDKMNTGRKSLEAVEKLENGIKYIQPVSTFGSGIQHLEHLNTIEKTRKTLAK